MEGIPCDSISGTNKNYEAGKLSWQQPTGSTDASAIKELKAAAALPAIKGPIQEGRGSGPAITKQSPRDMPVLTTGFPLRTPDRVLRIWVAPYEDDEGALNDQKYVFVTVEKSAWQVEANKRVIQAPFRQIYPLGRAKESAPESDARAIGRSQAQAAVINNPNLTNLPAQPKPQEQQEE
jgi:conjugal transfer pilus assembly protein TraV